MIKKITKVVLVATLLVSAGAAQASGSDHYGYHEYATILSLLGSYTPPASESSAPLPGYHEAVNDPYHNLSAVAGLTTMDDVDIAVLQ